MSERSEENAAASGTRIGTAEREHALQVLTHHVGTGRLSLCEFDERATLAATATTKAELVKVLVDLPAPVTAPPAPRRTSPLVRGSVTAACIAGLAAALVLSTGNWLWFLLIAAFPLVHHQLRGRT